MKTRWVHCDLGDDRSKNSATIKRKEYDNGLVLLTEKIPSKKKAKLMVGVKVGSVDETERLLGGSHFNEHLLFKSNKHRTAKQIAEDLEQSGTSINAYTSEKETVFHALPLSSELDKVVPIAFEAVTNLEYDTEEFEREREVILTEIKLYNDQPMAYSGLLFQSTLFKGTPLEIWPGGTLEAMDNVTKGELEDFKHTYYVPNNMVVVVVGNFDEKILEKKVKETFGSLKCKELQPRKLDIPMENVPKEKFEEKGNIDQTYMFLGYRVPGITHKEAHMIKMLRGVLSAGMSSRLFVKLREERGIGYAVGADYDSFGDEGALSVRIGGFDSKRFDEAKDIILGEFTDLKHNLASDKEFKRTRNLYISKLYDHLDNISSRASQILGKEFDKVPYDFRKEEHYLKNVTKEQVREMANKYFTDDYTLTALVPAKKKPAKKK